MWIRHIFGLLIAGMLWGCTTGNGTTPTGSMPLFQVDATDRALLEVSQREQERLLAICMQHQSCDQVHFTRAMIALFQNGEEAATSFQQAIDIAPDGPFADSSARWIRFLSDRTFNHASADPPHAVLLEVMSGLVRTWLGQQRTTSASVALRATAPAKNSDQAVHSLKQRIRDRDKRIAELTDQLSALKQIDSEAHRTSKLTLPRSPSK
jgi:hypothetical protein